MHLKVHEIYNMIVDSIIVSKIFHDDILEYTSFVFDRLCSLLLRKSKLISDKFAYYDINILM